jgi:hypothetical protein
MSSHLHVYVGPFFLVPKVTTERTADVRGCSTPNCRRPADSKKDKFCSVCGGSIEAIAEKSLVEAAPSLNDMSGNWDDVVAFARVEDDRVVWLPNRYDHGESFTDNQPNDLLLLQAGDIEVAKAKFVHDHRSFATAFETQYGKPLEVAFGVVPHFD